MRRRIKIDFASTTLDTAYAWVRDAETHSLIGSLTGHGTPPTQWRFDAITLGAPFFGDTLVSVLEAANLQAVDVSI